MKISHVVEAAIIEDMDKACLDNVLTIAEVVGMYRRDYSTVYEHCVKGRLVCRQALGGNTWLISKRSCDEKWGKPE